MRKDVYRPNVAIIILNKSAKLLWCQRKDHSGWQFPQGGIDKNESPEEAIYRETEEEVGLNKKDLKLIHELDSWIKYDVPKEKRGTYFFRSKKFKGQKQKWFLAEMLCDESKINIQSSFPNEFDKWCWVNYWYPLGSVVNFKKEAYRKALIKFMSPYNDYCKKVSS